jgi:uncharacterized protein
MSSEPGGQLRRFSTGGSKGLLWLGLAAAAAWAAVAARRSVRAPGEEPSRGGTALVTGAASGIGEAFSRRLAGEGCDLILVDRQGELLETLAEELRSRHGVAVETITADLSDPGDVAVVERRIEAAEWLSTLVNNAGYCTEGFFADLDIESQTDIVAVHDIASMRFLRAALPQMKARHGGDIINVASMLAMFPFPGSVTYNATKSFLVAMTETLHLELLGTGVRVQVLCPGFTHTHFHDKMDVDMEELSKFPWMQPQEVVEESLEALRRGRVVCVPGSRNRMLARLGALPRGAQYRLIAFLNRDMLRTGRSKLAVDLDKLELAYLYMVKAKRGQRVTMRDGVDLFANVFLPRGKGPWPAVITAFPYQIDGMGGGMSLFEGLDLLKAGYAFVAADLRGHGASEGISGDPFEGLRGEDLYELVEWCARQKWCDGNVGMEGESYGGMSAIKAAAENPPSLKAVFSDMAPMFFYRNLAFPGGSFNMLGVCGTWLNFMNLTNLFPPLYLKGRPDWRRVWEKRLDAYVPYIMQPSRHVDYDEYWRETDFAVDRIKVPTYILEGWRGFSYRDGLQAYGKVQGPRKVLMGPWTHYFPSICTDEPVDYMRECIRWFDRWLKGEDNGIEEEPPLSVYVMGKGYWKYEDEWPPAGAQPVVYYLHGDGTLGDRPDEYGETVVYEHDPAVGVKAGLVAVFPFGLGYPLEQGEDDERSLTFDSLPLPEPLEIAGEPVLTLTASTTMPDAAIRARLCDVTPDGRSTLITGGWLRMSHRDGDERPEKPQPGQEYVLAVTLFPTDYRLEAGHRLRVSISLSDFPYIFPLPYKGDIELDMGPEKAQRLEITAIKGAGLPEKNPQLAAPDLGMFEGQMDPQEREYRVLRDAETGRVTVHWSVGYELPLPHLKSPMLMKLTCDASVTEGEPDSALLEASGRAEFPLEGRDYLFQASQVVSQRDFEVKASIEENGKLIYDRDFSGELNWV